jgi:hypothetical protein
MDQAASAHQAFSGYQRERRAKPNLVRYRHLCADPELKLDASLYTCLQILSVSIFEKTDISCALQPNLNRTYLSAFANQLNLFDI